MLIGIDTNIAIRAINKSDAANAAIDLRIKTLCEHGWQIVCDPQVLYEIAYFGQRPLAKNGLGFTWTEVNALMHLVEEFYEIRQSNHREQLRLFREIFPQTGYGWRQVHDVRLACSYMSIGINQILTQNPADFAKIPNLTVLTA